MTENHPDVPPGKGLDLRDLAGSKGLIAESAVWHKTSSSLSDMREDDVGLDGVHAFCEAIARKSCATFRIDPRSVTSVGEEGPVAPSPNTLTFEGRPVFLEVAKVWQIIDGRGGKVRDIGPGDAKEVQHG